MNDEKVEVIEKVTEEKNNDNIQEIITPSAEDKKGSKIFNYILNTIAIVLWGSLFVATFVFKAITLKTFLIILGLSMILYSIVCIGFMFLIAYIFSKSKN